MCWVSKLTASGTAAHITLVMLNYIMHSVGIFIVYMSIKLKGKKKKTDNIASVEKDL